MDIFSPNGTRITDAPITQECEQVCELMKDNYIKLSWRSASKLPLPVGTYVMYENVKYSLLDEYTPTEMSETEFKYEPEFKHPTVQLGRMPFCLKTTNSGGDTIKEYDWNMTDRLQAILSYLCLCLNEDFNTDGWSYQILSDIEVSSATCAFSNVDYLSALNEICSKFGTENKPIEYIINWENHQIYVGANLSLGQPVLLKVGDNISIPSVSSDSEGYYNRFVVKGSSRNIWQRSLRGENVSANTRLTLDKTKYPNGYIDMSNEGEPVLTKVLVYDNIYPKLDLYVYDVRERSLFLLDDGKKVIDHYDGQTPIYKKYSIWYIRLAYPVYENGEITEWRDFAATKDLVLDGYTLMAAFIPNENGTHSALAGREFKMYYHQSNETLPANSATGDSGVTITAGDYEINFDKDNDIVIPTTSEQGLIPWGEQTPTLRCDKVVLFNLAMSNEYLTSAQEELEEKALSDIAYKYSDRKLYTFKSNPKAFESTNTNIYVGRSVIYEDISGNRLSTRVTKIVKNLAYPFKQEISVGNAHIKGNTQTLKEDVKAVTANVSVLTALQNAATSKTETLFRNLQKIFQDYAWIGDEILTKLSKTEPDTAQQLITFLRGINVGGGSWVPDDGGRTHLTTDYLKVNMKATFEILETMATRATGGKAILSPAGSVTILKVTEQANSYRCYFLARQDGEGVTNKFQVNDLIISEGFNTTAGTLRNVSNHFYWRKVVAVDGEPVTIDGKQYHYVDLSKTDCAPDSDAPKETDVIAQLGNKMDKTRQSAIVLSAVDTYSPCVSLYYGIDNYSLTGKEYVEYGVDKSGSEPKAFFHVYGDAHIGSKSGGDYVDYDSESKTLEIKARINANSTLNGTSLINCIREANSKTFVVQPFPPYKVGDLWVQDSGDVLKCTTARASGSFNAGDWGEAVKYTDDTKINSYINEIIHGTATSGSDLITAAAAQRAIMGALDGGTTVDGGLVLTSLIGLRQKSGNNHIMWAGVSGQYNNTPIGQTGYAKGNGIAIWVGGNMVDKEMLTDAQINDGWNTHRWARTLFRFDGSGYEANGNISWDKGGGVTIRNIQSLYDDDGSLMNLNKLTELTNIFHTTLGAPNNTLYILPQNAFSEIKIVHPSAYTIDGTDVLNMTEMDDRYLTKEIFYKIFAPVFGTNGNLENLQVRGGLWTNSYISALGQNSSQGGGSGTSYNRLDTWSSYDSTKSGWVLSALLGNDLNTRLTVLENGVAPISHTHNWSDITNTPTTLNGYGITDAYISNGVIRLGSQSITPITSHQSLTGYATESWVGSNYASKNHTHAWSDITGKPTTLSGYGITDAYISNGVITLGTNTITPITSLAGYATEDWVTNNYLGLHAKADDSDKLDGYDSSHFANAADVVTLQSYFASGIANNADKLDGYHAEDISKVWYTLRQHFNGSTVPWWYKICAKTSTTTDDIENDWMIEISAYGDQNHASHIHGYLRATYYGPNVAIVLSTNPACNIGTALQLRATVDSNGDVWLGLIANFLGRLSFRILHEGANNHVIRSGWTMQRTDPNSVYIVNNGAYSPGHLAAIQKLYMTNVIAECANRLNTSRTIWGQSFNGTDNVSGNLTFMTGSNGMYGIVPNQSGNWDLSIYTEGQPRLTIKDYGNVGIGTSNPTEKLTVNGNINTSGTVHSTVGIYTEGYVSALGQNTSSDIRLKDVQGDVDLPIDMLANAPSKIFEWKSNKALGTQVGTIAQYWQKHLPQVVHDNNGYLAMQYDVTALLGVISVAKNVKSHEERIAELERENKELKQELKELRYERN